MDAVGSNRGPDRSWTLERSLKGTTRGRGRSLWMDINGAKALKKRLSLNGTGEAAPAPADVDIAEDAPPVFHWLGVPQATPREAPAEDDPATSGATLFRRLGLSFP